MTRIDYRLTKKEMSEKVAWWYEQGRFDMMMDIMSKTACKKCQDAIHEQYGAKYAGLQRPGEKRC